MSRLDGNGIETRSDQDDIARLDYCHCESVEKQRDGGNLADMELVDEVPDDRSLGVEVDAILVTDLLDEVGPSECCRLLTRLGDCEADAGTDVGHRDGAT
ncbi:MAG: hypothetical protein ACRD0W_16490 [Acidimicrobiales bacterium]